MKRKRNPAKSPVLPLLLAAGGAYLLLKKPAPAAVNGIGWWGNDVVDAVSNAAQQVRNVVQASVSNAVSITKSLPPLGLVGAAVMPLEALSVILPMATGGATFAELKKDNDPPPPPAPVTVYQDENGKEITEAEYNRLMAEAAKPGETVYKDASGKVITKEQYEFQLMANTQIKDQSKVPTFQAPPAGTEWFWETASAQWRLRYKQTPTTTTPQVTPPPPVVNKVVTPSTPATATAGSYSGAQNTVQYAASGGATVAAPTTASVPVATAASSTGTKVLVGAGAVVGVPLLLSMLGGN